MKNGGNAAAAVDDEHEADAEAQGPATPKKRARETPMISAMKGARADAKRKLKAADDEDEEVDEEEGTPMGKKRKVRFEDQGLQVEEEDGQGLMGGMGEGA